VNGGNPNGKWELFVQDDAHFDTGIISNGWFLTLTMASPVGPVCDLAVSMTSSATDVLVGNFVTNFITVTNYGSSTSSNAILTDTLPLGVTLVSTTPSQGSVSGLIWSIGTLASGSGAQLTLTMQPNSIGTILNYAIAGSDTSDLNPADDFASVSINVGAAQPPQFGSVSSANGVFRLAITNPTNPPASVVIQASTNLASANWIPVYTNIPPFIFTNFDSTNYRLRFYRARLGP
jgi:uncharacterized repeat protein (TIGR01451 family)